MPHVLILLTFVLSPALAELSRAPEGSFSFAVIPDTQRYRGKGTKAEPESDAPVTNDVFHAYASWIRKNLERQRIVFASHVGDIVDRNVPGQWAVARAAMDRLHGRVPYGISVGNHDMTREGDSSLFQEHFPASRYEGLSWYGGAYTPEVRPKISGNNTNSYQLFKAGGIGFVFLHLECNAPDAVLAWADDVLTRHRDRAAFVTTHMSLGPLNKPTQREGYFSDPKGLMQWTKRHEERGNSPQEMWDKCFAKHPNLKAVFSGDQSRTQSMYAARQGDSGNIVHYFVSDYGSNGLRVYRFFPGASRVDVITYNPITESLCDSTRILPDRGRHQFSVHLRLK